jgi:nitroreductase
METKEAIRTVLAVREYSDKPVSPQVIRQIVEAARLTGSSQNKQPWHFIVVQQRETLRQIAALSPSGPYIADAAFAVVVAVKPTPPAISDASRAIQSMALAAWSEGIGSNWVGVPKPGSENFDALKSLLSLPDEWELAAILPFGYPAKSIGMGKKNRKPLAEIASSERFGTLFAG